VSDASDSVNAGQAPASGDISPAPSEPPTVIQTPEPPTVVQTSPPVAPKPPPPALAPVRPPIPVPPDSDAPRGLAYDRPEIVVGGAFAGGILLALILKRLGH
jgi:hypothetical protein